VAEGDIKSSWAVVQDHARHFSDFKFVYPVISRRSQGLSIGVNLNPDKICNFDCVYCEVDRRIPGKDAEIDLKQLQDELEAMISFAQEGHLALEPKFDEVPWLTREVKDIAFSGDGEPTMIGEFAECVEAVVAVQQKAGLEAAKIVLITDAAGLGKVNVKQGLKIMDAHNGEVWGKLDAGTEDYYRLINRSHVKFERILSNLKETAQDRPIIIQSLFLKMYGEVMNDKELQAYCDCIINITEGGGQIREVHLYTIARPVPEDYATKLAEEELMAIGQRVKEATGMKVQMFS